MLRVYGITYDHTTNYGSCLQAYALQTAIENVTVCGDEPCQYKLIPLLKCKDYPKPARRFTVKAEIRRLFNKIYGIPFSQFENEKMHFAECGRLSELDLLNAKADAFSCGSDVIWKPEYNHDLSAYYLGFARKYKFSYAASFGMAEIADEIVCQKKELLERFDQISLREQSSKQVVERYISRPVKVVADPVLLCSKEMWNSLINHAELSQKYIFVYYSKYSTKSLDEFVRELEKLTGLRVIKAAWYIHPREAIRDGAITALPPQKWLNYIRDAEFVVTNSFHATVFSTIFSKKLFAVVEGELNEGRNVRLYDYLKTLGLSGRLFNEIPKSIDLHEIDYSQAEQRIKEMREESFAFLKENLEAAAAQRGKVVQRLE